MKKFFKVLLLAAVALMPVMGIAQTENERDYNWERQMRSQEYYDSVQAVKQQAEYEHEERMTEIKNARRTSFIRTVFNEDLWMLFVLAGGTITIVILCLRHSRSKAEDHKELINKLIDNNLLNSTEPISKEVVEALMKPKKSEKDKYITDGTLLGVGLAGAIICVAEGFRMNSELALIFFVLTGIGLLRIVTRAIFSYFERKHAKDNIADESKVEEVEIVEEK